MITLSATTLDLSGSIRLQELPSSTFLSFKRRVSSIATLDGSGILVDYGYSESDRKIKIIAKVTAEEIIFIKRLMSYYAVIVLASFEGVFIGAISSFSVKKAEATITFMIQEKL